jgi:hypothetical protein
MRQNRLWWFGFGFAAFGFGTNTGLRIATMPVIGWQPSQLIAEILLGLSFFVALFGLSLMAYTAIPENLALKSLPVRVFLSRNRTVFLTWLLGVLVFAFMAWQSLTIYRLQAVLASRQLNPWQEQKIVQILSANPCHVDLLWANTADARQFAGDFFQLFPRAQWKIELREPLPAQYDPTVPLEGIWIYRPAATDNTCSAELYKALRAANIDVRKAITPNLNLSKNKCALFIGDKSF